MDYAFIGSRSEKNEADDSKLMPVLVMKEKHSKMTMASVVPKKGSFGVFASKRAMSFLKEIGLDKADIVIKSDQEAAVGALVDDIKRMRNDSRTVVEYSPVRTPKSNGLIERSVMSIKEQVKVMKSALEARWQRNILDTENVVTWLVEYSAVLLNRREISKDGKTSYERLKGKRGYIPGVEFGEKILYKKAAGQSGAQALSSLWAEGIFLGLRPASGEYIVGNSEEVTRARTLRRRPEEIRWNIDGRFAVRAVPWNGGRGDPEADGLMPEEEVDAQRGQEAAQPDQVPDYVKPKASEPAPRRFYIKKYDLEKFGHS